MEWVVKNVKILVMLLVASLAVNAGTTIWLLKTEKELTRAWSTHGNQPNVASMGMQGLDMLSVLKQMDQRLTRLEDIAERKEQAGKKGRAEQRKFFQSPVLPVPSDSKTGTGPQ
jgi:hypothetical protein